MFVQAPVSLAGALQEYLNDPNFEQNRIEYKASKEAVDRSNKQQPQNGSLEQADDSTATGTQRSLAGSASQTSIPRLSANPMRSLGDAMKEIKQRFDEILENEASSNHKEQQMDVITRTFTQTM